MARGAGLKDLVGAFVQEGDSARRDELLEQIVFRWAGADGVEANSRGGMIDARKLVAIEHFLAESFDGALGANPVPDAAIQLERAWHDLTEQVNAKLMAQSHLAGLYQQITYTFEPRRAVTPTLGRSPSMRNSPPTRRRRCWPRWAHARADEPTRIRGLRATTRRAARSWRSRSSRAA
jgi:hypothetical protein